MYLQSVFNVGGFLVAQFVLMLLLPSHWPFIAAIALSASCKHHINKRMVITMLQKRRRQRRSRSLYTYTRSITTDRSTITQVSPG